MVTTIGSSTPSALPLSGLSSDAEKANVWRMLIHFSLMLVVVFESFHLMPLHAGTISILLLTILSALTLVRRNRLHHRHREAKLKLLIEDSFGIRLNADSDYLQEEHIYQLPKGYFSTTHPPGIKRLQSNLAETLFFAGNLYGTVLRSHFILLLLPATLATIIALCAPLLSSQHVVYAERIFVLLVVFLNEVHLIVECIELQWVRNHCDKMFTALVQSSSKSNTNSAPLMYLLARYQMLAISTAYPPSRLYTKHQEHLNSRWRQLQQQHDF